MAGDTICVLYVDKFDHDRHLIRRTLAEHDSVFQVIEAESREEFEQFLAEGACDLVLTELGPFDFDSVEIIETVQAATPDMPVIIITGAGSETLAVEAMKRGAADYLPKTAQNIRRLPDIIQTALVQNQVSFQSQILQNVRDGIQVTDLEGRTLYWNQGAEMIFGYVAAEMLGQTSAVLYPDQNVEQFAEDLQRIMAGQDYRGEWEGRRKNGSTVWIDVHTTLLRNTRGKAMGFIGVFRNISGRKQLQQELWDSEERYRQAAEAGKVGIWAWDLTTNHMSLDPRLKALLGYEHYEIENHIDAWTRLIHPDDREDMMAKATAHIEGLSPRYEAEYRMQHKDGSICWILARALVDDDPSQQIYRLVGTCTDITERKQAEEALRESERRLATLMANLPGMAYHCRNDRNWSMAFVSDGCLDLTGYQPADLLAGGNVSYVQLIHPDDREQVWQTVQTALDAEESFEITYRITTAGGQEKWVWEKGQGVFVDETGMWLLEGFINDVTERKQAEENLKQRNQFIETILDSLPIGLAVNYVDDGSVTYMNRQFEQIYGWPRAELTNVENFFNCVYPDPDYRQQIQEQIMADIQSGDPARMQWEGIEVTGQDGRKKITAARNIPLFEQNLMISTVQDITERKQAEQALQETNATLQGVIESAPVAIVALDRAGVVQLWSPGAEKIFGWTAAEIVGQLYPLAPTGKKAEYQQKLQTMWAGNYLVGTETRRQHKDKTLIDVVVYSAPLRDQRDKIMGTVVVLQDITQRKQAEAALRAREESLRITLNSIGDAVIATDIKGRVIRMNPVAQALTGWPFADAQYKPLSEVFDIVNAHTGENVEDPVSKVLEKGEIVGLANHTMLRAKDGSQYQIADSGAPIRDDAGNMSGIVLVFRDVTEEYHMREKIITSETLFRAIIEQSGEGIGLADQDGNYVTVNPAFCRMTGYSEAELLTMNVRDLMPPPTEPQLFPRVANKQSGQRETELLKKDNSRFVAEIMGYPVELENQCLVLGIVRDITEQKKTEEKMRYQALLLRSASEAIIATDSRLQITAWNEAATAMYGWSEAEALGQNLDSLLQTQFVDELQESALAMLFDQGTWQGELVQQTKAAQSIYVMATVSWIKDPDGAATGGVTINRDITKRKQAEAALRESEERLRTALQAANMATWDWDVLTNEVTWSEDVEAIFGLEPGTFAGTYQAYLDLVYPQDLERVGRTINQTVEEADDYHIEHRLIWPSGEIRWIKGQGRVVRDDAGRANRMLGVVFDITGRKRAEQRRQELLDQLTLAIKTAKLGIWTLDLASGHLEWNDQQLEIYGITRQEFEENLDGWRSQVHPDDAEYANGELAKVFEGKSVFDIIFRVVRYNGEVRTVNASASPVYNQNNELVKLIGINFDITKLKQAEAKLHESEQRYRLLYQNAGLGVGYYSTDGTIIAYNEIALQLIDKQAVDVIGKSVHDLFPKESADIYLERIVSVIDEGKDLQFEDEVVLPGGTKWYLSVYSCVEDLSGTPQGVQIMSMDITQRKRTEQKLRFRSTLLNAVGEAVIATNLSGEIIFWNKAAEQLYGWSQAEVMGHHILDITPSQEMAASAAEILEQVKQGEVWQGEFLVKRKNGEQFPVLVTDTPLYDESGNLNGLIGISRDITELRAAYREFEQTQEKLQLAVDGGQIGLWNLNLKTGVNRVNSYWAEMLGYTEQEAEETFDFFNQHVHPDDLKLAMETLARHASGELPSIDLEIRMKTKQGHWKWIYDKGRILEKDDKGEPVLLAGTHVDITERKQAEERLRESEARYRTLFEDSPISLWEEDFSQVKIAIEALRADGVTDFQTYFENHPDVVRALISKIKVVDVNQSTVILYQADSKADFLGSLKPSTTRFLSEFIPQFVAVATGQTVYENESQTLTRQGEQIYIFFRWSVAPGHEETLARVFVSMVDITETKQAQQVLQQYTRRLENLRQIDRAILASESIEDTAAAALQRLGQIVPCHRADVSLIDTATQTVETVVTYHPDNRLSRQKIRIPLAQTTLDLRALRRDRLHLVEDYLALDNLPAQLKEIITKSQIRASMTIPLFVIDELIGIVGLGRKEPGRFTSEEIDIVQNVADQLAIAIRQARLLAEERDQRQLAEALSDTARILNSSLDVEHVLDDILANAGRVVPHEAGDILIVDEEGIVTIPRQLNYVEFDQAEWTKTRQFPLEDFPVLQNIASSRKPQVIPDTYNDQIWVIVPETSWIRSYVCAPIFWGKDEFGFISLSHTTPGFYSATHAERLQAFADQVGFALQNAYLYEQIQRHAQELEQRVAERTAELKEQYQLHAAQEERQRLARDLHDAVSQTLFSSSIIAETLPRLWQRKPEQMLQNLEELHRLNRGALAEMRTLLLELRPTALEKAPLPDLLRQLADSLMGRTLVTVSRVIEVAPELPPEVKIAIYRIAQEAFNNIVKHARASHVTIFLQPVLLTEKKKDGITLIITDDGQGFDLVHTPAHHMGLRIMRERADTIGAALTIASQPGQGTTIEVVWPH